MGDITNSNNATFRKTVLIKASPGIVFQALTDARDLVRWFCDRATSDPREGGELTAYWKTGARKGRAVFLRVVPGAQVEIDWLDDDGGQDSRHVLSYMIKLKRGTSEVTMNDVGLPLPDEETYAYLSDGWNQVLLELKDYCERKERSAKRPELPKEAE
jgi:uncharacterized protein YndB with AHSA1/START domain